MPIDSPLHSELVSLDALLPPEMARKAAEIGVNKARMDVGKTFSLALLAGAFIALGAILSTAATSGAASLPYGVARLIAGVTFSLGLILVVVGGAELFTGNNLIVMAWASGKVTSAQLLRNWLLVFAGNLGGALFMVALMFLCNHHELASGRVGLNILSMGEAKCSLEPIEAIGRGIACNVLVCLAVWLCYSARTTTDRILAIVPPITAFVACGFEHSIANMYFVPMALCVKSGADDQFWQAIGQSPTSFPHLTWSQFFLRNLLPVTAGNVLGGSLLVGLVYWSIYLRQVRQP